jgi:hypothetical protein
MRWRGPSVRPIATLGLYGGPGDAGRLLWQRLYSPRAHRAVSLHHIEVRILSPRQVGFELRCAESKFSSFKLRLGAMLGSIQE